MATPRLSTRQRLVDAAFELFSSQGVGTTTTRQVADRAGVNEVTLFRQFGSKHGLLAAVVTEADELVAGRGGDWAAWATLPRDQALRALLNDGLDRLTQRAELVRSVIGEAGQFSAEQSGALGQGLQAIRHAMADFLDTVLGLGERPQRSPEAVAELVIALLVGYTAIASATDSPLLEPSLPEATATRLWPSRDAFVESTVQWLLGLASPVPAATPAESSGPGVPWPDLPAPVVHQILQAARRTDAQTYALVYVLLGAGVAVTDIPRLTRASAVYDSSQHLLLVGDPPRPVPLNQWIWGRRYGTYSKNPLTRWLKGRSDDSPAMFLGPEGQPITAYRVRQVWAAAVAGVATPLAVEQARVTWGVEMLLRGLSRHDLALLSGLGEADLEPLVQMAQARSALAAALQLDRAAGKAGNKLDDSKSDEAEGMDSP